MNNQHLERGRLLLSQGRHDLAESELRQGIGIDPNNPEGYAFLSLCLLERKDWTAATDAAVRAITLDPSLAMYHMILADVYVRRRMHKEAREAIDLSLQLDPTDPDAWATLAQIEYAQSRHKESLAAAEKGLVLDARHEACVNLRAIALANLGQRTQATEAIEGTLSRNPLNATSHANMGWTLLHQGKPKQALEHFREALRLDPGHEWARNGILEAMKARNLIYRLFLAYFLFMSRLTDRAQWAVIIGGYIGIQVLKSMGRKYPDFEPWVSPIIAGYMVFALGTVVAIPLFNLFLLSNRFGRYVLNTAQKVAAACFGVALLPGLVFLTLWITVGGDEHSLSALTMGVWCLPVALAGLARAGKNRIIMIGIAGALGVACVGTTLQLWGVMPGNWFSVAFFGCLLSTLVSNVLSSTPEPIRR